MTTEALRTRAWFGLRSAIGLALFIWLAGLVGLTAAAAPAGDYWAIGPRRALFAALAPADAALIRESAAGLIVRGGGAATVRALYAHGAWLVLPAAAGGCMALRRGELARS